MTATLTETREVAPADPAQPFIFRPLPSYTSAMS
jgi:hypothetical protein